MIQKIITQWFGKDNWYHTCRGIILFVCSILYVLCDDHADKIITAVMTILTIDSFSQKNQINSI
jgi:hypothetical protein